MLDSPSNNNNKILKTVRVANTCCALPLNINNRVLVSINRRESVNYGRVKRRIKRVISRHDKCIHYGRTDMLLYTPRCIDTSKCDRTIVLQYVLSTYLGMCHSSTYVAV